MLLAVVETYNVAVHLLDSFGREGSLGVAAGFEVAQQYLLYARVGHRVFNALAVEARVKWLSRCEVTVFHAAVLAKDVLREVVDFYLRRVEVGPCVLVAGEVCLYELLVVAELNEVGDFALHVLVHYVLTLPNGFLERHFAYSPEVHLAVDRFLVQRLAHGPAVAFHLVYGGFLSVDVALVCVRGLVDYPQVLLEAHDDVAQGFLHVCGERRPRLQELARRFNSLSLAVPYDFRLFVSPQLARQLVAVGVVARHGRLVVEQVDVAARCAGYHYGVHGVVAVVNPFLVESLLQFERHVGYLVSAGACRRELARARKLVEAAEARQHYAVPHVLHAPVFLKPVGYRAVSGYDVL